MPALPRNFAPWIRPASIALLVAALVTAARGDETHEVKLNGQTFTLPAGFTIELVAGPPLVERPIAADFDEQGRLYVADSSGSNEPVQKQLETKPHRIVRLTDENGDGRFDKSTVYADKMMFPEGALWYDGSLYVAAPPHIWKLTDADDDGIAEKREIWFDGKTLNHCANDLHGPFLGPDGYIYWCKGAFEEQTYPRPGRPPLVTKAVTKASHIFRRHPSGGPIEAVMTGGMDNPVDVVFTPSGERIFSATFLVHPGGGLRDGLTHAIYGGVYGKDHGVLAGHPRTGPLMPTLSHLGAAAPCGLARLEMAELGEGYRDNLLCCLFNMRKVTRHVLTPAGASFTSRDEDFVVSDALDFHPTDVLEDADGSVLIVDTGGWYKICCPTSQLPKPDVLGAIYRIRRTGAHQIADPRGQKLEWERVSGKPLIERLGDERFAVRNRARRQLSRARYNNLYALLAYLAETRSEANGPAAQRRLNAIWALSFHAHPKALKGIGREVLDKNPAVRQAALNSVSLWRDGNVESQLLSLLRGPTSTDQRLAAECLGRIGSKAAVAPLLKLAGETDDRALEHAAIYAVLEIGDAAQTRVALEDKKPRVRRAALLALEQMPEGKLKVEEVLPLIAAEDSAIRETGWWIIERHPDWAGKLTSDVRAALASQHTPAEWNEWSAHLARMAHDEEIQTTLAGVLNDGQATIEAQQAVLAAMTGSKLKGIPQPWAAALASQLKSGEPTILAAAVGAVAALAGNDLDESFVGPLRRLAANKAFSPRVRLQALATVPAAKRSYDAELLGFACRHLSVEIDPGVRALAADVLVGSPLDDEQLATVAAAVPTVGTMELKRLLEVFAKSTDEKLGRLLLASLSGSAVVSTLPREQLQKQLAGFGDGVLNEAAPLFARIDRENEAKTAQLEAVLTRIDAADIRRGQQVFHSTKAACAACHAMGYLGGKIGPDLTRIGNIRSERDLLESILFPSASLVRSYEPTTIVTSAGLVHNGIIREESPAELTLQLDAQKQVRIAIADIDERRPGAVSLMPAGLEKQLTPAELADLVKFLKAAK